MSLCLSTTSFCRMIRVENFGRLGRYDFVHLIQATYSHGNLTGSKAWGFPADLPLQVDHDDLLANIDGSHRGHLRELTLFSLVLSH